MKMQSSRPVYFTVAVGAVTALMLGSAALTFAAEWTSTAGSRAGVEDSSEVVAGDVPAPARCRACGVIESVRSAAPAGGAPAAYELTVRLADGSVHKVNDANPASWRPGERMILIAGRGPAAK
jgi:hypothetical protein